MARLANFSISRRARLFPELFGPTNTVSGLPGIDNGSSNPILPNLKLIFLIILEFSRNDFAGQLARSILHLYVGRPELISNCMLANFRPWQRFRSRTIKFEVCIPKASQHY